MHALLITKGMCKNSIPRIYIYKKWSSATQIQSDIMIFRVKSCCWHHQWSFWKHQERIQHFMFYMFVRSMYTLETSPRCSLKTSVSFYHFHSTQQAAMGHLIKMAGNKQSLRLVVFIFLAPTLLCTVWVQYFLDFEKTPNEPLANINSNELHSFGRDPLSY